MDLRDSYTRQVKLLMAALPHVAKESCFALKRRHRNQFVCAGFSPSVGGYRSGV